MPRLLLLLIQFALIYAGLVVMMYFFQGRMLFPTYMVRNAEVAEAQGVEPIWLTMDDGTRLYGVVVEGPAGEDPEKHDVPPPFVLAFGGNAQNAVDLALFLAGALPQATVAAVNYRGYGQSEGQPSATKLRADAVAIYDQLAPRMSGHQVLGFGASLGSGVTAWLASQRPLDGAVLMTPYDSLLAVGQQKFPWLPVGMLFKHNMQAAEYLTQNPLPVALIMAENDHVIPTARARALQQEISPMVVFSRTLEDTGHNSIFGHGNIRPTLRAAVAAVLDAQEVDAQGESR